MSLRNLRKLLALSALLILTLAAALGAACVDGSGLADQDRDDSDVIGLPDDDNGLEPARVNPNAPAAPTNLTATIMSYNRIDLAWNDNSSNEVGFKAYRKLGSNSWVLIGTLAPGVKTCQAIGLKPGKTYGFKVIAYNTSGKSTSNVAQATTPTITRITSAVGDGLYPSLVWTGSGYGVSWVDGRDGWAIYFARISSIGVKLGVDLRITSGTLASGPNHPSLAWTGSEYGVSWEDERDGNEEIYFARISSIGVKLGADLRITSAAGNSWNSSIVWTGSEYGVSWDDGRDGNAEIYFARISAAGVKLGADLRITSDSSSSAYPSLNWINSEYGVSWSDGRDGNAEIYFARISAAGVKLGSDLRITSDTSSSAYPSLAWAGSEYGVSWSDGRDGNAEIYFARISADGVKLGADLRITSAAGNSGNSSIVWTGSEYGVSWDDGRDGNADIYFCMISAAGVKLGADIPIISGASFNGWPSLVWDGSGYGISWDDDRDNNSEIYFSHYVGTISGETNLPLPPSNLVATAVSNSQINLAWTDSSNNETGFKIERKTGFGGTYAMLATVGAGITSYPNIGLAASTTYYYRVRAYNGAGDSNFIEANATTQASPVTIPNAPSGLLANSVSSTQINLAWTDSSNNETGFKIERKTGVGGTWSEITTVSANVTSYMNAGLAASTTYYYRIRAYNGAGDSAYCAVKGATTQPSSVTIPNAPSGLSANSVSSTQINLGWIDNSNNETGFKIERKTGVGGTWSEITTVGANVTSYLNAGLAASTTYYYRVWAYNGVGDSTYSNEANATTQASTTPPMALIPSGCFNMGDAFSERFIDERPVHNVCLPSFNMDVKEVTNAAYAACVSGGGCTAPSYSSSITRGSYYGNSTYNNFPVIYVNWNQATAYCSWAGKRLPTEAEWEYAARGGLSGKRFPWGDTTSCVNANYYGNPSSYFYDTNPTDGYCIGDTSPVGNYAANGYGLYDMSGNVWEWVNDWYLATYYTGRPNPDNDPPGPNTGSDRVLRGGSWNEYALALRVSYRLPLYYPTSQFYDIGFRCAGD